MVEKIQITATIIESSEQRDYLVPANMRVKDVIELIMRIAFAPNHPVNGRLEGIKVFDEDRKLLCPSYKTVQECGLSRGSKVILL